MKLARFSQKVTVLSFIKSNINYIILKINKSVLQNCKLMDFAVWQNYRKVDEKRLKSNLPKARNTRLVFSSLLFLTFSFSLTLSFWQLNEQREYPCQSSRKFVNYFDLNGKRSKHRRRDQISMKISFFHESKLEIPNKR